MNPVSEGFLLNLAQIAATLIGLLLVGVLFYAETGLRQLGAVAPQAGAYFRSGTVFVLLLYSLVLGVALALVAFEPVWAAAVFGLLGLAIVAALVSYTARARAFSRARPEWLHPVSAWLPWPPTVLALGLPWLIGGWPPGADAYVPSMLLAGALAFLATASLVLLTFELASLDGSE